jgi:hypothetical protein
VGFKFSRFNALPPQRMLVSCGHLYVIIIIIIIIIIITIIIIIIIIIIVVVIVIKTIFSCSFFCFLFAHDSVYIKNRCFVL